MTTTPTADILPGSAPIATASPRFFPRLMRRRLALVCLGYLAIIVLIAVFAPIVLPWVAIQHAGDLTAIRQGPSIHHLLGSDSLGRDVLQRLLVGTRVTMIGVSEALVVVLALGVPFGLAAGYYRGWIDSLVSWLADLTFSMPAIVIVLLVLAVFPQSMAAGMASLGVIAAPGLMRLVRSATLPVREELYIAAARVSGLSGFQIIARHVLPRIAGVLIVQASLLAAVALLIQTGLAFLGLVVAQPAPSWGGMVADGARAIELQPWLIWPPGMAIVLTILALGLLGDSVRDTTTEEWSPAPATRPRRILPKRVQVKPVAAERRGLLSIEALTVAFASRTGRVNVVEDVSFDVEAGETVGIVGESGCGKTVTAMAILGLLSGTGQIEAGRVVFDGRDLAALPETALRRIRGKEIGLVSQEPMISLNPVFRIGWQLAEAVQRHRGLSRRAARRQVLELLHDVRLSDPEMVARRYPHELSGGMAQRVAIARALAGEPRLLIADEPTTSLDVTVQAEILELLRELKRVRRMAILFVTHDWGIVADICERVVVMYAGQVVERGAVLPIFRHPLHPYTEALLASNPHHSPEDDVLPTIPGTVPQPGEWPPGCHFNIRCKYATAACFERPIAIEQPSFERETRCIHYQELARH